MENKKKILIVTPKFPWPVTGAAESDRVEGVKQFLRLGFDVKLIAKISESKKNLVPAVARDLGIDIFPITYKYITVNKVSKIKKYFKIFFINPLLLDGAAYEYTDPELMAVYKHTIDSWRPDYVVFDLSYMWPLIKYAKSRGIKVITRSQNFEAEHFLQEEGKNIFNIFMYWAKLVTEFKVARGSDLVWAITPYDAQKYKQIGVKKLGVLPLRGLPGVLKQDKVISNISPLKVFFSGATYNVKHNRRGLEFILKEIAPLAHDLFPGKFVFNILGSKFPDDLRPYLNDNTIYIGFVDDYEAAMADMDIALVPSLSGGGMQQKVFEPLVRGIPTISSARAMAGYPFKDKEHLLLAKTAMEFVDALDRLLDPNLRQKLSQNSLALSRSLFSLGKIDAIVKEGLKNL